MPNETARAASAMPPGRLPEVLRRYDIGEVVASAVLHGGMFERPLMLETTTGRYVLRRHTFRRTESAFRYQAEAMQFASEHGVRCPKVVRCADGAWCVPAPGAVWALQEYADGQVVAWTEWCAAKSPAFLRGIGQQVARIHDILAEAHPSGNPRLSPGLPTIQFGHIAEIRRHWRAGVQRLADAGMSLASEARAMLLKAAPRVDNHFGLLGDAIGRVRPPSHCVQVVHGDISPVNMVFAPERAAFELIDWDCTHRGFRLYDALGDVVLRAPWDRPELHTMGIDELRLYLSGYADGTARSVAPDETALVPAFCFARQLEDLRQRLAVLPGLPEDRDREYAALIGMRLGFLDQLAPLVSKVTKGEPWIS